MIGVGQGLVPGLGGGQQLAVTFQHAGQDGERLPCSGGGLAAGAGGEPVVAGQLGGRARAGDRVGAFGGEREDVGDVDVGAAGQGDVGVRAVFGAGDHGQAGVDGAALGGVVGDRVAEFGIFIAGEQEVAVGPAALAGARVGVQRAAHDQAAGGDGVDAEQVAVGQRAAGLPRLDGVVVFGADDQVAGAGLGAVGDGDRGAAGTMPKG